MHSKFEEIPRHGNHNRNRRLDDAYLQEVGLFSRNLSTMGPHDSLVNDTLIVAQWLAVTRGSRYPLRRHGYEAQDIGA
ncbi:hypothetical protein SBOR_3443 [Sclerotinia borealis F-4128]|uniref:Uncharacterized protein n=1 Tax=Sclerotinia borealis (strain F-4128) TaxID=1432307 RepID=W9CJH9_SCLBF|nr:hypothetical protein SBOR_3443 [Sclerotinia borealis F-4128]